MPDVVDKLSKVSGVRKEAIKEIWENVKANHRALEACPKHDFQPVPKYADKPDHPLKDYKCKRCGGVIDAIAHSWYLKGIAHASA
jgi:hypothetical protein